jgi:hypothetical protein
MKPYTWSQWTRKEEILVEALRLDGLTCRQIALQMGKGIVSVQAKVQALGANRSPEKYIRRWMEAIGLGLTVKATAAVVGLTPCAVKIAKSRLRAKGFHIPSARGTSGRNQYSTR